jgi:hypothetical protein
LPLSVVISATVYIFPALLHKWKLGQKSPFLSLD